MSEQLLIEQLDEVVDAIIARDQYRTIPAAGSELAELAVVGSELRLLPRENFKSSLKQTL